MRWVAVSGCVNVKKLKAGMLIASGDRESCGADRVRAVDGHRDTAEWGML